MEIKQKTVSLLYVVLVYLKLAPKVKTNLS